jgi:hypothetical protein
MGNFSPRQRGGVLFLSGMGRYASFVLAVFARTYFVDRETRYHEVTK